jgi:hypothetical protein
MKSKAKNSVPNRLRQSSAYRLNPPDPGPNLPKSNRNIPLLESKLNY